MNSVYNAVPVKKSTFVTVLAWIFIGLAGSSSLIAIVQNILLNTLLASAGFDEVLAGNKLPAEMPWLMRWLATHIREFAAGFLLLCVVQLVAAIGLLRRQEWGRRLFIALMVLAILWNLAGFYAQTTMISSMGTIANVPAEASAEFHAHMRTITTMMMVVGGVMVAAFSVLFGWIIKRLLEPAIAAEFRPAA